MALGKFFIFRTKDLHNLRQQRPELCDVLVLTGMRCDRSKVLDTGGYLHR